MRDSEIEEKINEINDQTTDLDRNAYPWKGILTFFKEVWIYFNDTFIKPFKRDLNLNTAEGFALEEQAGHWAGVYRNLAIKTEGKASFNVSRNLNISEDLILDSPSGLQFRVKEAIYAQKPGAHVKIEALVPGFESNLGANTTLTSQRALNGLESIALREGWIQTAGEDEEDDESLRNRIRSALVNQAGGDIQAKYISRAKEVKNVRDATVWPIARGAGSADLVIAAQDGVVTQEMLNEILGYLENWGLINWDISIIAAKKQILPLRIYIKNPNLSEEAIAEKVKQYALSLKIADVFRLKDLYTTLNYDINILSPVKDQEAALYSEWETQITFTDEEGKRL